MGSISSVNSLLSSALTGSSAASGSGIDLSSILQAATGSTSGGIDVTAAVTAALNADRAPEQQWRVRSGGGAQVECGQIRLREFAVHPVADALR